MIARDLAELIGACEVRPGLWRTNCPAHSDRSGRLKIIGSDGVALRLECMDGCPVNKIIRALGLTVGEIAAKPEPSPDTDLLDDSEREAYYAARRDRQAKHSAACRKISRQLAVIDLTRNSIAQLSPEDVPAELKLQMREEFAKLAEAKDAERRLRAAQRPAGRAKKGPPNIDGTNRQAQGDARRARIQKRRRILNAVNARETQRGNWIGSCPTHDGERPALLVRVRPGGRLELKCTDGCELEDILAALGLEVTEEFCRARLSRKEAIKRARARITRDYVGLAAGKK